MNAEIQTGFHAVITYPSGRSIYLSDLPGSFVDSPALAHVHATQQAAQDAIEASLLHFRVLDRSCLKLSTPVAP